MFSICPKLSITYVQYLPQTLVSLITVWCYRSLPFLL